MQYYILFNNSKYLVLGPGAQRTFRLTSRKPLGYLKMSCIVLKVFFIYTSCVHGVQTSVHKNLFTLH